MNRICVSARSATSSSRSRRSDRKSTRLNSSHVEISYAVFCLKKKTVELIRTGQARPRFTRLLLDPPSLQTHLLTHRSVHPTRRAVFLVLLGEDLSPNDYLLR